MNAQQVMRLIDVLADLDSPSAAELRAFADRALVQLRTEQLRIGIATEGGRPIADLLRVVDEADIKRDVWSFSASDRPTGVDAWILVLAADQVSYEQERKFASQLTGQETAAFVTGFEMLGPEASAAKKEEIELAFRGVIRKDCFLGSGVDGIQELVEEWSRAQKSVRESTVKKMAAPMLESVTADAKKTDDRLAHLPDPDELSQARAAFEERVTLGINALNDAASETSDEIREEIRTRWDEWVDTFEANHGEEATRERLQGSLETWLSDRFVQHVADRLRRRLTTHMDNLPQLSGVLASMETSQKDDFTTPAVEAEAKEMGPLRWLFPLAGGGLGWMRGGPRQALIGAALGLIVARVLKKRRGSALRDGALILGAQEHVAAHIDLIVRNAADLLETECNLELERRRKEIAEAEAGRPERARLAETRDRLARVRALLAGVETTPAAVRIDL